LLAAIVLSAGILGGIVYPLLSGEQYDHYNVINLTPDDCTQALMITNAVVFWVEDPDGNEVGDPLVYTTVEKKQTLLSLK
jgi:hypothetical protein